MASIVPLTNIFSAAASSANSSGFDVSASPTKVVLVATSGFSGTLTFQGLVGGSGGTWVTLPSYSATGASPLVTSTLSYTTDTNNYIYVINTPCALFRVAMTRTAGTVTADFYAVEADYPTPSVLVGSGGLSSTTYPNVVGEIPLVYDSVGSGWLPTYSPRSLGDGAVLGNSISAGLWGLAPDGAWDRLRTGGDSGGGLGALITGAGNNAFTTILSSAARTSSGTGTAVSQLGMYKGGTFVLDVTAAATAAGDTLNVYLQGSYDSTNYFDFASFTQVLGNGGAKKFRAHIYPGASAGAVAVVTDATMTAGTVIDAYPGPWIRAKWVVVSASAPNFTFAVYANLVS